MANQQTTELSASEWAIVIAHLRMEKPSKLEKMYGKNPTEEQKVNHTNIMKSWESDYRKARKFHKIALERDNKNFWENNQK